MVAYHIDIVGVIGSSPVPPTTYIKDIEKGELFVCENEGQISAVFAFLSETNRLMTKFLPKNGFQYCGIIKKKDGSERLVYQTCN